MQTLARAYLNVYADPVKQIGRWCREEETRYELKKLTLSDDDATAVVVFHATGPRYLGEGVLPLDLATIKDDEGTGEAVSTACKFELVDEVAFVPSFAG